MVMVSVVVLVALEVEVDNDHHHCGGIGLVRGGVKKWNNRTNMVGHPFFSKERNVFAFFCVLYKRMRCSLRSLRSLHSLHSLRSFTFFITLHSFWFHKSYKNDRISQKRT